MFFPLHINGLEINKQIISCTIYVFKKRNNFLHTILVTLRLFVEASLGFGGGQSTHGNESP